MKKIRIISGTYKIRGKDVDLAGMVFPLTEDFKVGAKGGYVICGYIFDLPVALHKDQLGENGQGFEVLGKRPEDFKPVPSVVHQNGQNYARRYGKFPVKESVPLLLLLVRRAPRVLLAHHVHYRPGQGKVEQLHNHQVGVPSVGKDVQIPGREHQHVHFLRLE